MKYKVYVYAISKNEEKFVNRWINSVSEADKVFVLDTGSTDKTVKKLKEKDLIQAALDPKELNKKIDPAQDLALYLSVNNYVTTYFLKIHEIMISLDKRKVIDYEEVQDQMKAIYRRLKKANKSKLEIFTEISNKVHRVTLQDDIFCQIVVSYFIQSCEVF